MAGNYGAYRGGFNIFRRGLRFLMYSGFFNFLSDEKYVSLLYWARLNEKLDLRKCKTFNEKMQWLKVNDHKNLYTSLVDKIEMKKIVSEECGKEYLIPTIGIYENFDEIRFGDLPNAFVIKCTHDSGSIVICSDKKDFNIADAKRKIMKCMKYNYFWHGREWPYKYIKPRILIEPYVTQSGG